MRFDLSSLKYNEAGLIPAIVQDAASGVVLMMAYMNREALKKTLATGETWFWSRSRKAFWHKGETSGNVQRLKEVLLAAHVKQGGKNEIVVYCYTGHTAGLVAGVLGARGFNIKNLIYGFDNGWMGTQIADIPARGPVESCEG